MRLLATTLLCLAALCAPASAARDLESTFQDDNHLIYTDRAGLRNTLDRLAALGVDRVRVTVLWKNVAPNPGSRQRPNFDATDPASYPPTAWERYDALVEEAHARGIAVNFNLTGPVPLWATKPPPREDVAETYEPDPVEFGRFARAVGTRYSGNYPPSPYVAPGRKLPKVDYWTIWNEPNHSGWLTPQWRPLGGGKWVERAPVLYRELLDWSYAALLAAGHGQSTILIGETAPGGEDSREIKRRIHALLFVRDLYCVDRRFRFLKGRRAQQLGCGTSAKAFAAAHPGLFQATGFAHHPYELLLPPTIRPRNPDHVNIAALSRLTRTLDRTFRTFRKSRRYKLYLTEYGYQTRPDPVAGQFVSFAEQAAWLNQAEYIAWRSSRVKTLSQFLLYDDDLKIPASFQSGLLSIDGKAKPSLAAYRFPVHVYRRRGARASVWGRLRPATGRTAVRVQVKRGSRWRTVKTVTTAGYFTTTVRARKSAQLRLASGALKSRVARVP